MTEYHEFVNKEVTCRKSHSCGWCAERVDVGERARYREYLFDGQWVHDHMHMECYNAMMDTPMIELQDGWMPGDYLRGLTEWA